MKGVRIIYQGRKYVYCFLILIVLSSLSTIGAFAQVGDFILEAEQHWETYGVGGTCNHGTHNLFIADVDGDNVIEIITGGFMYYYATNNARTIWEAPLTIWSWNGQNLTLEKSHTWVGSIDCVYVADADSDGTNELITAGSFGNQTGSYNSLRVWNWNNEQLSLKANYEGVPVDSIFVSDLDGDNKPEIITVGRSGGYYEDSQYTSQICLWHLERNSLILKENLKLDAANVTRATSVYAFDLDADGSNEVITGGYSGNLNNSKGQLSVWQWNGEDLSLKANANWQTVTGYALNIAGGVLGNTVVNNLKVGDIDGDHTPEIVTGGFTYDGERAIAQFKIWSLNGNTLAHESGQEWTSDYITEVKCISLGDVDGDSNMEIVTGGMVAAFGSFGANISNPDRGQLGVWSWDGATLTKQELQEWTIAEGFCAWNVGTADLESDGTVEIVTVGCMSINKLCDPDMRIWSIRNEGFDPFFSVYVGAGIVVVVLICVAIFFVLKKRK